jgi:hypothetical protein
LCIEENLEEEQQQRRVFFLPDHDEMVVARTFDAENSSWLMMILNQDYCICASSAS